jgi:hypothetical protein
VPTDERNTPMPASKTALLVALVAVGVVIGGVAAASLGGDDTAGQAVTTDSSIVTTTVASDDGVVGDLPDDGDDDGTEDGEDQAGVERYWGEECGDGPAMNHGQYVAATPAGESRREAAHSPCGKPLSAVTVASTTTATTLEPPTDETFSTGASGGNGNGNTNGNGRGNGGPPTGKGPKGR